MVLFFLHVVVRLPAFAIIVVTENPLYQTVRMRQVARQVVASSTGIEFGLVFPDDNVVLFLCNYFDNVNLLTSAAPLRGLWLISRKHDIVKVVTFLLLYHRCKGEQTVAQGYFTCATSAIVLHCAGLTNNTSQEIR